MTCFAPLTKSMAPPIPATFLPGIIQFAKLPSTSTSMATKYAVVNVAAANDAKASRTVEVADSILDRDALLARINQRRRHRSRESGVP